MAVWQDVFSYLDGAGIKYEYIEHEPVTDMASCVPNADRLGAPMPRNIFLTPRNRSMYLLAIVPPFASFRTSLVSKQLGCSRLSFAPADILDEYLHTQPGAVSPMGLIFDTERRVRFAMDRALMDEKRLAFHPCADTMTLALERDAFLDFIRKTGHEIEWIDTRIAEE